MDILECRMLISLTSMVYVPFIEVYFFYNEVKITQAIAANERHAATKETTETTNTLMLEKTNKIAVMVVIYLILRILMFCNEK
ncbi:hypothetical protein PFTANZ_02350 [Plasmodium falciparum Tanzania (2000708)]|uniref:Uncharacterized protein n=2 Tax=Plasmodium falciparum TaxID=5833 RepID=A0A024W962_PLAFA|nr:hypothetical protein PFTANZ_02350 [Plasmodium falciparum Tanzania (2000708)]ETW43484.1 hypothetical protein PFNF135_02397 [Plasmodium falciparum NF135/5.C10]